MMTSSQSKTIVILADKLSGGGLERTAAYTSLVLETLGYSCIFFLHNINAANYFYGGKALKADVCNANAMKILHEAHCILDYTWRYPAHDFSLYAMDSMPHVYVPTVHNTDTVEKYIGVFQKNGRSLEKYPAVLCVSNAVRQAVHTHFGRCLSNTKVVYNTFSPHLGEQELEAHHGRPYFLFLGRLRATQHKGIDILLRAWAGCAARRTHRLRLVGGGELRDDVKKIIDEYSLAQSLSVEPFHMDVEKLLAGATALLMPSRWEGFGLVCVEALACRTPCIATRLDSVREYLTHEYNGLLVDCEDVSALSSAIDRLATDHQLRARLSARARPSVERFAWPQHVLAWKHFLDCIA